MSAEPTAASTGVTAADPAPAAVTATAQPAAAVPTPASSWDVSAATPGAYRRLGRSTANVLYTECDAYTRKAFMHEDKATAKFTAKDYAGGAWQAILAVLAHINSSYRVLVAETKEGKWVADLRTASRGAAKQARAAAKEARDAAKEMHEESKSKKHEKGDNGHHGDKAHANNGHHGETPMNNAAAVVAA